MHSVPAACGSIWLQRVAPDVLLCLVSSSNSELSCMLCLAALAQVPGSHPNIDILLEVLSSGKELTVKLQQQQ
jgi:hypothetical protein